MTAVWLSPIERRAALRSRWACRAGAPRSAFVTTRTSGISMIPDFRNWSTSPAAGWTTTATVSAASATSISDCPTPTVSITTTSNAAASAWAAARVAGARPPRRSPAAIERTKTPRSAGSTAIRARSPSSAPPERRDDGSTARTATRPVEPSPLGHELGEQRRLAGPGRPGDADDVRRRLAAEGGRGDAAQQRRDLVALLGRAVLDEVQHLGGRAQVPFAQARGEVAAARARHLRDASRSQRVAAGGQTDGALARICPHGHGVVG